MKHFVLISILILACVDAAAEVIYRFQRPLDRESQRMRGVAMASQPSAFAGIGLDVVRERDAQLDFGVGDRFEFCAGPRKLVKVHVACFCSAVFPMERLELVLCDQRQIVRSAKDSPLVGGTPYP